MTDAEYYRMKAAFEARRTGRAIMNLLMVALFPFAMLIIIPIYALKLIFYIGGISSFATTEAGREALKAASMPVKAEPQGRYNREVSNGPTLENGFNPDLDSDWVGAVEVRRQERGRL